jgi:hypothetical protein
MIPPHTCICSMCIKTNQVDKQEVGIWWVQKRLPRYGVPIWSLWHKYQIPVINSCWEKCDEKCAYMLNVYKSQLSRQTGSRNLTGQKTLPTKWGTYINVYEACDEISDICHHYLLRKMWRKICIYVQCV